MKRLADMLRALLRALDNATAPAGPSAAQDYARRRLRELEGDTVRDYAVRRAARGG